MDGFSILQAQQKDFCQRVNSDNLLISHQNTIYSEATTINHQKIVDITDSLKTIIGEPHGENLYKKRFIEKIGQEAFKLRYSSLVRPVMDRESGEVINDNIFCLKQYPQIKILVKTIYLEQDKICWNLSQEEINHNQIFIGCLCRENFDPNTEHYTVIFGGFIPTKLIEKKIIEYRLYLDDLCYNGGLKGYLESLISESRDPFYIAKQHCLKGEYINAISSYSQIISQSSYNEKAYLLRAITYYKKGDKLLAIKDLSEAINLNQDYLLAYHWRGFIYEEIREYEQALKDYTEEIRISPISFLGYYKRAFIYTKLKDYLRALDDFSTSLTINPSYYLSYYNRAYVYFQLGDKQDALDDYDRALSINPYLFQAHYGIGVISQLMGNYNRAIASYSEAIRLEPRYEKPHYNLAILQANLGYYQKAIQTYENILEIKPDFIEAKYNQEALIKIQREEGNILGNKEKVENNQQKKIPHLVNVDTKKTFIKKD
ncbi:MAG: tetratricopeptide repeat protein [Cyanobacterium sp. T60_A2020_053]|nr:tetratricopeptide repeat protein [Cyanobacterium sp. T60_A2020_053]